jgi:hypothetical protein
MIVRAGLEVRTATTPDDTDIDYPSAIAIDSSRAITRT